MEKKEMQMQQIIDWISSEENMELLSQREQLEYSLAFVEFLEKIKPIVVKKMSSDKSSTFIFKL